MAMTLALVSISSKVTQLKSLMGLWCGSKGECVSQFFIVRKTREVQPRRTYYFYLLVSPCGWLAPLFLGHSEVDHDYREAWRRKLLNLWQAGNREKGLESVPPVIDLQLDPAPKIATNSVLKVAPPPGVQVISV